MKCIICYWNVLSPDLIDTWSAIQQEHRAYASPYFRPEFSQCVAAVRDDVHIGILEGGGRPVGFFPFHRSRGGVGRPIGLGLSDYHGVIVDPAAVWSVEALLRGCGLVRYDFDHLLAQQTPFSGHHEGVADSPIIDVSSGYDAFEASRDRAGRKQLREIERKRDKLTADMGAVEFTLHSASTDDLHTLMAWKSEQCKRTGTVDYFAIPWCRQLIERIHQSTNGDFGGLLSTLRVDGALAAAHFAMRSRRVWHSWFPVYSEAFQAYSPGQILLQQLIRAAAERGIDYIDLGKDVSTYKKRVMTGVIRVASGSVELPSLVNNAIHLRERIESWSRTSVLRPLLRVPGRIVKGLERKQRYT